MVVTRSGCNTEAYPDQNFTAEQHHKDAVISRLGNTWPLSNQRENQNIIQSRGLRNVHGFNCYANASLQVILHAPKIMSWIMSHNATLENGTTVNRCIPEEYRDEPQDVCVPCAMKTIIGHYWGDHRVITGRPRFLDANSLDPIFRWASARLGPWQQDAQEFLMQLLDACLSYTLVNGEYEDAYDALFNFDCQPHRTCNYCQHSYLGPLTVGPHRLPGLDLAFQHLTPPDTVQASLDRYFGPELLTAVDCPNCDEKRDMTSILRIRGAPEILKLNLKIGAFNPQTGASTKLMDAINIPSKIRLGRYTVRETDGNVDHRAQVSGPNRGYIGTPLVYRLSCSVAHIGTSVDFSSGTGGGGHYIAAAKGIGHVYKLNDATATRSTRRGYHTNTDLTANPQGPAGSTGQAYVLTYIRDRSVVR